MAENPVVVKKSVSRLMMFEGHSNLTKRITALTASGITEVVSGQQFYAVVVIFRKTSTEVPKHMLIAIGDGSPECVVHMTGDENNSTSGGFEKCRESRT